MVAIQIQDEQLVQRLQKLSELENRPIEAILKMLLDQYTSRAEALKAMAGMFDDDITDLSTTVRETMTKYYTDSERDEHSS